MKTQADRIKELMVAAGLRPKAPDLSSETGININTARSILNDNRPVSKDMAPIIARRFKVSPGFILYGKSGPADEVAPPVPSIALGKIEHQFVFRPKRKAGLQFVRDGIVVLEADYTAAELREFAASAIEVADQLDPKGR